MTSKNHGAEGAEKDVSVEAEAGLFGILGFEHNAGAEGDVVVTGDLPEAGDAGLSFNDVFVVFAHGAFFIGEVRAIANDGHFAF